MSSSDAAVNVGGVFTAARGQARSDRQRQTNSYRNEVKVSTMKKSSVFSAGDREITKYLNENEPGNTEGCIGMRTLVHECDCDTSLHNYQSDALHLYWSNNTFLVNSNVFLPILCIDKTIQCFTRNKFILVLFIHHILPLFCIRNVYACSEHDTMLPRSGHIIRTICNTSFTFQL